MDKNKIWESIFGVKESDNSTKAGDDSKSQMAGDARAGYHTEIMRYANSLVSASASELNDLQIPGHMVKKIEDATGLDAIQLAWIMGMSKSKYYRVLKEEKLDLNEVDILSNFLKLWKKGITVFDGISEDFEEFLNTTNTNLGRVKPIDLLGTETGRREVDKALDRIEYSLYG